MSDGTPLTTLVSRGCTFFGAVEKFVNDRAPV